MRNDRSFALLVLAALMFASWLPGCGNRGGAPDPRTDAALEDAATDPDAGDAATAPDAATRGCSADDRGACAYVPPVAYGELPPITRDVTYTDVLGEDRTVQITLRRPDGAPQPWPVIVWSHGGMPRVSSVTAGEEWGHVFTRAGFAFVAIAHRERDDASRLRLCEHFGVTVMADCARVKYLHYDQPNDFREVVDYLEVEAVGPLAGFLDLERLLYAGQSAGSGSTSMIAGASRTIFALPQTISDPRPIAFIGASMEGPLDDGFADDAFDVMARPHLTLSGVGDYTPEAEALPRRLPFERMMPGDKYRVWITDPAARHMTFNHELSPCQDFLSTTGGDPSRCDEHMIWLESAALAFADAYLHDLPAAHAWLASDDFIVLSGGVGEWNRR